MNPTNLREAFEKRTHRIPDCECWLWGGVIHKSGYGTLTLRDGPGAAARHIEWKAHRLSFALHNGPLVDGLVIMHSCDNKWCVNPAHLSQAPQIDNIRDMFNKGRNVSSESKRTACPQGHPYSDENTYRYRGGRWCRICKRETVNRHARRARAKEG